MTKKKASKLLTALRDRYHIRENDQQEGRLMMKVSLSAMRQAAR
jgi:hypothetical protein